LTDTGLQQENVYPIIEETLTEKDIAADIHFTKNGKRLYVTVRGKNQLSVFNADNAASLKFIGSYPTFGDSPRNFCFSPGEEFVIIAHQISGHINVCPLDAKTGAVGNVSGSVVLPGAACVINA
jgi:6-phosphogluconolactonase